MSLFTLAPSILWAISSVLAAPAPTEPGGMASHNDDPEVAIGHMKGYWSYVAARTEVSGVTGVTRTIIYDGQRVTNCRSRWDREENTGPLVDANEGNALRCVVRAIVRGLDQMSNDAAKATTRIGIGDDVRCALGELRIGTFVGGESQCAQATSDSTMAIHVDSVLVRVYHRYLEKKNYVDATHEDVGRLLRHLWMCVA